LACIFAKKIATTLADAKLQYEKKAKMLHFRCEHANIMLQIINHLVWMYKYNINNYKISNFYYLTFKDERKIHKIVKFSGKDM